MVEKLENKEKISDKEKLKEIQSFVQEMYNIGLSWDNEKPISVGKNKLKIEGFLGDGGSFVKIILSKDGKEVFNYNMNADMFHKDRGEKWPVSVNMKIDGKNMIYNGDDQNQNGVFKNYELLDKALKYKKEIKNMLKRKELSENLSEFKDELSSLQSGIETPNLA